MRGKKHIKRSYRRHALWRAAFRHRQGALYRELDSLVFVDDKPVNWWDRVLEILEEIEGER